ncbi:MAG TPA: hypothetical protein VFN78_14925 [Ktedonobacterales bacterium]|nr:hypothetical protein [Ktedonobacterales bacterium]
MATLLDAVEAFGGASAIWNEFEITVTASAWEDDETGVMSDGWIVQVKDFVAAADQEGQERGLRPQIIRDERATSWDELAGVMAELGLPDGYEGWR